MNSCHFIRSRKTFFLGIAGYPEGHPEAPSREADLLNLKRKVDAGGEFIITQLFFDNRHYVDFTARARAAGIDLPIIPGIMPITDLAQIKRFTQLCGAEIPSSLVAELEAVDGNKDAVTEVGIRYGIKTMPGAPAKRRSRHPFLYVKQIAIDADYLGKPQGIAP